MKFIPVLFIFKASLLLAGALPVFFEGNQKIAERELYSAVNLYKPYFYEFYKKKPSIDPKTVMLLSETIKNYYRSRGFFHTSVTHAKSDDSIVITISEEAPIIIANITTISKLDISLQINFKEGDIFNPEKFTQSKKEIKLLYANNSYCNASLIAKAWVDTETNYAYLMYEAIPNDICYFGFIEIIPSENIDADIIESLLYIKENELFSLSEITKSYESIYANEGISKAIIDTKVDANNSVQTTVSVSENEKPIRFHAGLGINSNEGVTGSLGVKHRNLYSNLKTLSFDTRVSEIQQTIKTNFDMPLAGRESTGVEFGFENEKFIGFKESRTYGTLFLKQIEKPNIFKESLFFDNSQTYNSSDLLLYPDGNLLVISPKLEWKYDVRDNILDPSTGYFINSEAMGSWLCEVSDATYYKMKFSGGYILPLNPSALALKATFGSLHIYQGDIPKSYLFYAGGMYSNRAYGYRKLSSKNDTGESIGSSSILETSVEYRFPIYGEFKGVVFNDNTYIGKREVPDYDKGYFSAGVGIRYKTPIGPIAVDVGFDMANPTEQYALHFHIGELF